MAECHSFYGCSVRFSRLHCPHVLDRPLTARLTRLSYLVWLFCPHLCSVDVVMSRVTATTTPAAPATHVHLDPVTGAPTSTAPCCSTTPPHTTHMQPAHVTTHPASNLYLNTLYTVAGLSLAAVAAYAAYRFYTERQSGGGASSGGSSGGVNEKRAPYPVVELTDEKQFDSVLASVEANKPPAARVFVLVEGARDPATNVSWCGDCATADPVIERVFAEAKDKVSLIRAEVQRAAYKGNTQHPYRVHPQLQLQRIPTLYRMKAGQVEDQLIETEVHDVDRVRKFVNKP